MGSSRNPLNDVRLFPVANEMDAGVTVIANVVNSSGEPIATLGSARMGDSDGIDKLREILHAYRMGKKFGGRDDYTP